VAFLHIVVHEVQVVELTYHTLGLGCEDVCTRHYNLNNFPFGNEIKEWSDNKVRYAVDN